MSIMLDPETEAAINRMAARMKVTPAEYLRRKLHVRSATAFAKSPAPSSAKMLRQKYAGRPKLRSKLNAHQVEHEITIEELFEMSPEEQNAHMEQIGRSMAALFREHPELTEFNVLDSEELNSFGR